MIRKGVPGVDTLFYANKQIQKAACLYAGLSMSAYSMGDKHMAKSGNQKLKLLYLVKILTEQSDEEHCLSAQALIDALASYGISAERKSIYSDIAQLMDFGYDIVLVKARTGGGYYLAGRDFELAELKLLVETVQASRFLTVNKSRELISKIEKLASKAQAAFDHRLEDVRLEDVDLGAQI